MKTYRYRFTLPLFCLTIVSFMANSLSAQNSKRWFRKELGLAHSSVFDNGHSFAKYMGTGIQLQLGLDRETLNSVRQFNSILLWTPLKAKVNDRKNVTSATQVNYRISYKYLMKVASTQNARIQVAIGPSLFADANARYYSSLINNQFGWDVNLGVNMVGQVTFPVNIRTRSFRINYQLGIPMVTYNHSPNYLGTYPIGKIFRQGETSDWFSLGRFIPGLSEKYFYMNQQVSIDRHFANGDKVRLTYSWSYSNNGYAEHRYQNLITGVSIGILSSFSRSGSTSNNSLKTIH
jgi:hypothetical protein